MARVLDRGGRKKIIGTAPCGSFFTSVHFHRDRRNKAHTSLLYSVVGGNMSPQKITLPHELTYVKDGEDSGLM